MTCVHVCPYMAPQINEFNKAEVQGAVCMGCGSCTAECPAKAITLRHYVDAQILAGGDVQAFLAQTIERVSHHPRIYVHRKTHVDKVEGHVGSFKSSLTTENGPLNVKHGVVVVATGATEQKPQTLRLRPEQPGADAAGTVRPAGTRRI